MTAVLLAVWLGAPLPPDLAAALALRQALAELRATGAEDVATTAAQPGGTLGAERRAWYRVTAIPTLTPFADSGRATQPLPMALATRVKDAGCHGHTSWPCDASRPSPTGPVREAPHAHASVGMAPGAESTCFSIPNGLIDWLLPAQP